MKIKYISISGTVGIGKSSLTSFIAKEFNYLPIYENFKENKFLSRFYQDMKRWAFHSQTFFLVEKIKQIFQISNSIKKKAVVQDTSIYQDVYSYSKAQYKLGNMEEAEWNQYYEVYSLIENKLIKPDMIIFLTAPINIIYDRIKNRDRGIELKINKKQFLSYLKVLDDLNKEWINKIKRKIKVIELDTTNCDYVNDKIDRKELKERLTEILN